MTLKKKRILYVVNSKNYNVFNRNSAIDSILCSILLELAKEFEVSVNGIEMSKDIIYNSGSINTLSTSSSIKKLVPAFVKQILRDRKVFIDNDQLFEEIKKTNKPDVIIELMRYGSDLGFRLKEHFKVPLIAYFDAPSVEENKYLRGTSSPYYAKVSRYEEQTILHADRIIVYSEAIKEYWLERIPILDPTKFVIFQTLDYTRLKFISNKIFGEPLTIGFVGSFLKWHRVENLVKAFNLLRDNKYEVKLLLIGAGEEFKSVQQLVENSNWKEDITLTGFIDGEKLKENRNKIDIGVMPGTHWYCMPTKVFEYGASGIVSIVPGTKSIHCMFNSDEVVFLENNSIEELYKKLEFILTHKSQMKIMAEKLRLKIQTNNSSEQASAFYKNLITEITAS